MTHRMEEATERERAGQGAPNAGRAKALVIGAGIALAAVLGGCSGSGGGSGGGGSGGATTSSTAGSGGSTASGGTGGATGGAGGATATGGSTPNPSIGSLCPFGNECPPEAPACITQGEGDATAYCTVWDCTTFNGCPLGLYCGIVRDPHAICGSVPAKGDNSFCGQTSDPCIDPAADETSRFEGSLCLLRRACLYREQCAPCATDADCGSMPYQKCATVGGEKRCLRECASPGDCFDDEACQGGVCAPKAGSCKGTGGFCEPCLNDEDCGDASSMRACAELSGGMRACFDFAFAESCTTSADCPAAPSGKHGTCLDENLGLSPGDPQYHKCYLPVDVDTNLTSCW